MCSDTAIRREQADSPEGPARFSSAAESTGEAETATAEKARIAKVLKNFIVVVGVWIGLVDKQEQERSGFYTASASLQGSVIPCAADGRQSKKRHIITQI